jgi:hypothetical protein
MQVRHLAREELDVGATDAHTVYVDDNLTLLGLRGRDVLDGTFAYPAHDECSHGCAVSVGRRSLRRTLVGPVTSAGGLSRSEFTR